MPIVILDEPTAALDGVSESALRGAIDRPMRDNTATVIAPRLSTVAGADNIVVVEGGRAVEQGRYEELLAREGRYSAFWTVQRVATAWTGPRTGKTSMSS